VHFLLLIVLGLEAISAQTDPEVLQVLTTAAVYVGELDSAVRSDPLRVANRTVAVIPGAPGSGLPSERCLPGIGHRGWPERLDLPSRDVRWPKRAHGYRLKVRGRNFGRHGGVRLSLPVFNSETTQVLVAFTAGWGPPAFSSRGGFLLLSKEGEEWAVTASCYTWEA
jgi:hypothetical protein